VSLINLAEGFAFMIGQPDENNTTCSIDNNVTKVSNDIVHFIEFNLRKGAALVHRVHHQSKKI
jgi:hypothetical protein